MSKNSPVKRVWPALWVLFIALVAACASESSNPDASSSAGGDEAVASDPVDPIELAEPVEPVEPVGLDGDASTVEAVRLDTPCFSVAESVQLPTGYLAADVSVDDTCMFITQLEGAADTTVIAGELWSSSSGRSFDEFVEFIESGLAVGQEPDILSLQLLNSGPTGRDLPILERTEIPGPNRAVVIRHESDRRDGFEAFSAVVDFDTDRESDTRAFLLWGLVNDENATLIFDLIDGMQMKDFG